MGRLAVADPPVQNYSTLKSVRVFVLDQFQLKSMCDQIK